MGWNLLAAAQVGLTLHARSILTVNDLGYRYPGPSKDRGLDLHCLEAQPGQIVLLSGPSGCGKSTLARCLAGLIPHLYHGDLRGRVLVDGFDTADTPLWQLSERAGMVFQNPRSQMLAATVEDEIVFGLENLGLDRNEIRDRVESALDLFGLQALRKRAPLSLSGGEQQRVALAAITARRPPVLVLDEPLSMLDTRAVEELVSRLADLARSGTTVIICEHRTEPLQRVPSLKTLSLGQGDTCDLSAPCVPIPQPVEPFTLDVSQLSVRLGDQAVLNDLNLNLSGGEVVAIVGRNGVGKTTLLRALSGLQQHQGAVLVKDQGTVPACSQRPDLAMVFQNPDMQLFNATVHDEIRYKVAEPNEEWYDWLINALGLCDYEETPPLLLSEGEKKRVVLAIALMRMPTHGVLLDEPALGQDAAHKAQLMRLARSLAQSGRLVLLTTHDLTLAGQADRLLLMTRAGFVADGLPAEVLSDTDAWVQAGLIVPDWLPEAMP
jgi:energy-coupling factor transport system ATP-binding protein